MKFNLKLFMKILGTIKKCLILVIVRPMQNTMMIKEIRHWQIER